MNRPITVTMVALVALVIVSRSSFALGITTHAAISHDAAYALLGPGQDRELHAILEEFPGAMECGASWPDVHYAIQTFPNAHDAAEYTHWPPHYTDALAYIQRNFQRPYNEEARRLIAFYMGVIDHSVTDQWWHGINVPCTAALQMAEATDTDQQGGLEFNLDLYLKSTHAKGPTPRDDWYVPADHCERILHAEGYPEFTAELNVQAVSLSYIGAWLENLIGPLFYLPLKWSMPWTTAYFDNWPCGGYWDCVERSALENHVQWLKLKNSQFPVTRAVPAFPLVFNPFGPGDLRQRMDQHHRGPLVPTIPPFVAIDLPQGGEEAHDHPYISMEFARELERQRIIVVDRRKVAGGYELSLPRVAREQEFLTALANFLSGQAF